MHAGMGALLLFILSGLSASKGLTTVSKVSARRGESIVIPCLYDQKYTGHVKYMCRGNLIKNCIYVVRTDYRNSIDRVLSDDITQRVFTVTMNNLNERDAGYYWCGVKIRHWADDKAGLDLLVSPGTPELHVANQQVCGFEGRNVTVDCYYSNHGVKKWCRIGGSCVQGNSGTLDGMSVQISDDVIKGIFSVTLSSLVMKNTGWYWCSVGELQIPVHITVHPRIKANTGEDGPTLPSSCIIESYEDDTQPGWERVLYILLKAANALVYLTCSIVATVKVLEFRRAGQTGDRRKAKEPDRNRVEFIELRE